MSGQAEPSHAAATRSGRPSRDDVGVIEAALLSAGRSARRLLITREAAWLLGLAVAIIFGLGLIDYLARLPWWLRSAMLAAGLTSAGIAISRHVLPLWRLRPSATDLALRFERSPGGSSLQGLLASAIDLSHDNADADPALTRGAIDRATEAFRSVGGVGSMLKPAGVRGRLLLAMACLAPAAGVALWRPDLAAIGTTRVLTPWRNVDWPKRYGVADATALSAAAFGNSVPLKAVVYRTDRPAGKTDVWVRYRLITGETPGPVQRAALTGQGRTVAAPLGPAEDVKGELYERLIDPGAGASDTDLASAPIRRAVEYWFEASDDRTDARTIELVEPPAVLSAAANVQLPAYAARAETEETEKAGFVAGAKDLGPGRDDRATIGPVLAGSAVEITFQLNKPLTPPTAAESAFSGVALPPGATLVAAGSAWKLSFTAADALRLPMSLVDDYGIRSVADAAFQLHIVPDRDPGATVVEPAQDESVLATAILNVTGEGRDDVGVSSVAVELQPASTPAGSAGAPAEARGERSVFVRSEASGISRELRATRELDLTSLGVKPGDEIWLWAIAADIYEGTAAREPARSTMRRLRVISEGEFVESIRTDLASVRQGAMRLDQDQSDTARRLAQNPSPSELLAPQEGIAQRLGPLAETVRKLTDRVGRNNLADRSLAGLLDDAAKAVEGAASGAERAAEELRRAEQAGGEKLTDAQRESTEAGQRQARDELGRLISLLDSGQDGWVMRREIGRLLEEQRAAMAQTGEIGRETAGKSADELSVQEREQLEQLSQRQQELARRTGEVMDALRDRAGKVAKNDPALAQAMAEAARSGTKSQVQNNQRQAGEQLQKNQTGAAQQSQEKAAEALEQMLEDLDDADKNRDRALRAALEDIANSIGELITLQEQAITQLGAATPAASFAGLDAPMIALHSSTLGLAEKVRSGYRELAPVADHLDSAARAQQTAVTILRSQAPDGIEAEKAERISLDRLVQARAEAERLKNEAQDRDQARKRAELRGAYREALENQTALKARTDEFIGKQLDRRQRAGVRGLGDRQDEIRVALSDLRKNTEGLSDAKVFDFAHDRLDDATARAAEALRAGNTAFAVERDQASAIRVLRSLVEALKDAKPGDFEKGAQGSGSGGGQGGEGEGQQEPLVPPIAELRLLKGFQEDAAELTRLVHENPDRYGADGLKDVTELQERLARQAQELIDRSGDGSKPGDEGEGGEKKIHEFGYPVSLPPDWKPQEKKDDKPPTRKPAEPDSLDELLGLPGDQPAEVPAEGEPTSDGELEKMLSPEEIADEFAKAVDLMKQASGRLESSHDTGITTQRMQEDIVKRLEQIISAAERNSQQRMSQQNQKQQKQQGQQQPQPQQSQANKAGARENRSQVDPPGRQDGALSPVQPAPGSTWGNLPEHVRDALVQGRSDRFSSLYQALTEAYYRRLAEEAKPGAPATKEPR